MTLKSPPQEVIRSYCQDSTSVEISPLGDGNINDTFLVHTKERSIVLQRINDTVFQDPNILINNLLHLSHHFSSLPDITKQHWQDVTLIPALNGSPSIHDQGDALWRALSYIENSICFSHAETTFQAEQTGWALGNFHKRLTGLDVKKIQVPLPEFHNLGNYLKQYDGLNIDTNANNSSIISSCHKVIADNRKDALYLERTCSSNNQQEKIIHADPKIANVLFDKKNGLAISLIDLDTVGPGLLQHDIGDCLRSVCNCGGEEGTLDTIAFDLKLCEAALCGYFKAAKTFLTPSDKELIYDGIKAITYELGLRFFMDYLRGGVYFKCKTPEEILKKALVQFTLLQDIIEKENSIRRLTTF
jgi:thiamine kinase-like enzyme